MGSEPSTTSTGHAHISSPATGHSEENALPLPTASTGADAATNTETAAKEKANVSLVLASILAVWLKLSWYDCFL